MAPLGTAPSPSARPPGAIRLPLELKQMGEPEACGHRAGWAQVMMHLRAHHDPAGVLLDDFVERTFGPESSSAPWLQPWVGIFHHPQDLPEWLHPEASPDVMFSTPAFLESLPFLRGAVALSSHLGTWLEDRFGIPTLVLPLPAEAPPKRFLFEAWHRNPQRSLIQVGWYGRNSRAIYQVPVPADIRKVHLLQDRPWVQSALARLDRDSPYKARPRIGRTQVLPSVSNDAYDQLLSGNLVFLELFAASANNAVVESIARGTPVVVNPHPAVVEYLGEDYPLYYSRLEEVKGLLANETRIEQAHIQLCAQDPARFHVGDFVDRILEFVAEHGGPGASG